MWLVSIAATRTLSELLLFSGHSYSKIDEEPCATWHSLGRPCSGRADMAQREELRVLASGSGLSCPFGAGVACDQSPGSFNVTDCCA